jgi:hypothetical protein
MDEAASTVRRLNQQGQASFGVELAEGQLDIDKIADRLLSLADGEYPHARTQTNSMRRAAGDNSFDLDERAATVSIRGTLTQAEPKRQEHSGLGRELRDRDRGGLCLPVAKESE